MKRILVLTVCPEAFDGFLKLPLAERAVKKGIMEICVKDLREYAGGSFRHMDDSPFGDGAGMVMRARPILDAVAEEKLAHPASLCIGFTPAGEVFSQKTARELVKRDELILVCGHYEGMDERAAGCFDRQTSIGDYILSGGETAAQVVMDAVIRLLPGIIRTRSTEEESFENGLLEYPQYTQPAHLPEGDVPEVLLSGDHEKIRLFRLKESLRRTKERRPDLLEKHVFTEEEARLYKELEN